MDIKQKLRSPAKSKFIVGEQIAHARGITAGAVTLGIRFFTEHQSEIPSTNSVSIKKMVKPSEKNDVIIRVMKKVYRKNPK